MNRNLLRTLVVLALLAAGVWLALRTASPTPETAARLTALGALAPGRPAAGSSAAAPAESGQATPVTVNLAAVPPGVSADHGLYARWLRGEVDLEENEGIIPPAEIAARQARALDLPPSRALAGRAPLPGAPQPGTGWDSIDFAASGGWTPPDPDLAVGNNHAIAAVNSAFAVYDKSGALLGGPYDFAAFFSGNTRCRDTFAFDPNVLYDEAADRFILAIDSAGIYFCLAVSATANPLGNWNIYAFQVGSNSDFFDYPHTGVGVNHIFAGANIFGDSFKGSRLYAFDKAAMYAGNSARWASKSLPLSDDTPIPMHNHGWTQGTWYSGADHYFITDYNYNGATYRVWRWRNPLGSTSPAAVGIVNLQSYTGVTAGYPIDAPQKDSQALIQANDFRPHDFEYRDGFAWSAQTISCNPGGGTVNCVRWAKINPATAAIVDAGVLATDGEHRIFPNLAVNACGDMALGYTKTSPDLYPGIYVSGRESGDPAGALQAEVEAQAGAAPYSAFDGSPHRWGDYTGMTIDPDGRTFWYLGEYSAGGDVNGRWATYIRALTYPDCSGGPPAEPILDLSPRRGGKVGNLSFQPGDILHYEAGAWSMLFDASDVGITKNTAAFYREARPGEPDLLYLSLAGGQNVPGVGAVTPADVIKFTPTQLGADTQGTFSLFFDGSDVGLTTTAERIDALGMDGPRLLISTVGSGSVPLPGSGKLAFADEDVIAFTPTSTGATTLGAWAAFFDGSAAVPGLGPEDVSGFWDDPNTDDLYISVVDAYNLGGVRGDGNDVLKLSPSGSGYTVTRFWDGNSAGLSVMLDAFGIVP